MATISRLYSTGILQTTKEFNEITHNSIKVDSNGVYAAEFDETNLSAGTAERRTSDGKYLVSGHFDEYTLTLPAGAGQVEFTTAGTYMWTAPLGVTSVSVVCVGGGAGGGSGGFQGSGISGGGGGGLGWKNNITVVPEQTYTVVVGVGGYSTSTGGTLVSTPGGNGGDSYFIDTSTVKGGGGSTSGTGGTYTGDGGGNGGGSTQGSSGGAGGGAGGYTGAGGTGGPSNSSNDSSRNGTAGQGGGGGGGATTASGGTPHGDGGGVGILGQGANGIAGVWTGGLKTGGSGSGGVGITHGGGGAAAYYGFYQSSGAGGVGAVRIIWGSGRSFPTTQTNNV